MTVTLNRSRLAKLLGMLGSSHDGEILAAARAAEKYRREAGITWFQILSASEDGDEDDDEAKQMIDFIVKHAKILTEWERKFMISIGQGHNNGRSLTNKQRQTLERIFRRCQMHDWVNAGV